MIVTMLQMVARAASNATDLQPSSRRELAPSEEIGHCPAPGLPGTFAWGANANGSRNL